VADKAREQTEIPAAESARAASGECPSIVSFPVLVGPHQLSVGRNRCDFRLPRYGEQKGPAPSDVVPLT
jgi:hypothetical protein